MPDLIVPPIAQNLKCLTSFSKEVHHPQGGLGSQTLPAECHTRSIPIGDFPFPIFTPALAWA